VHAQNDALNQVAFHLVKSSGYFASQIWQIAILAAIESEMDWSVEKQNFLADC